ncbi:protein phosphatase [Niveomyces insectorum RCEF 264]|uniref:Protein phosphatase n=1 Tax=Niveomyces insectorum RCEF 264 TaxID=1081102 RepID=A0A167PE27_9HYPO|nr:protein phosphatase [Niveomyces insectorum RCEF 264]
MGFFGFPVDADLVRDAQRFTMDLEAGLERTLHGKVKIMITQCCIRHLYANAKEPGVDRAIDMAKTFERRRCGHRPDEFAEPLSTLECLRHVVDEKGRGENKHRYVVASQDQNVRRYMRAVAGVPLIYIARSVMIMEPMSEMTAKVGAQAERAKFRSELRQVAGEKRKRDDKEGRDNAQHDDNGGGDDSDASSDASSDGNDEDGGQGKEKQAHGGQREEERKKKKKSYGIKGPNPLSVKKKKKATATATATTTTTSSGTGAGEGKAKPAKPDSTTDGAAPKKKRKRKHKTKAGDEGATPVATEA